ncbi:MAG: nicotinate (nicotinamide) nucleotide adenylyltransferase [Erysipelotrichaceae bacterium]|nr:nicotinate (nicotinamide) nucleotide adenylyltransferase [Erysipelotrichaceae bacterium]MDY6034501.1 nicotinate (nicotinamide) nucleotide adenylyltransferase [Bulleidia sp.]
MSYLFFGGAFNPPTKAHIYLAEYACKKTNATQVIFMPTKMTYIANEQAKNFAFSDQQRYDMLKKICDNHPLLTVSDYELQAQQQPRTYQTLCALKDRGYPCKLLFGSDKLLELQTGWKHVEEIAKEFGIVCMERNEDDCQKMIEENAYLSSLKQYIEIIPTPNEYHAISSTDVRQQYLIAKQALMNMKEMLPDELEDLYAYLKNEE